MADSIFILAYHGPTRAELPDHSASPDDVDAFRVRAL
jgi:hypothetical protein